MNNLTEYDGLIKHFIYGAVLILVGGFFPEAAAQEEPRVAEIREIYRQTDALIAETSEAGESAAVFLTETIVNKNRGSYPAVGHYLVKIKFFYTFGDREKNPYPSRLLKIETEIERAAGRESAEFLFDEAGRLIFYFARRGDREFRVYFSAEKPFKILEGAKNVSAGDLAALGLVKRALAERKKLTSVFSQTLDY